MVRIESGGRWQFADSEADAHDGPIESNFAYVMGREGICLWSGTWCGEIPVAVEVHDTPPPPTSGWEKSVDLVAVFPSAVAAAFCVDTPREGLREIPLPAQRVVVRVLVNGWTSPPGACNAADSWLLQVWPAQGQLSAAADQR